MIGLAWKLSDKVNEKNERVPVVYGTIAIVTIARKRIEASEKKKKKSTTLTPLACVCVEVWVFRL